MRKSAPSFPKIEQRSRELKKKKKVQEAQCSNNKNFREKKREREKIEGRKSYSKYVKKISQVNKRVQIERTHPGPNAVDKNRLTPRRVIVIVKFENITGKEISQASSKKTVTSQRSGVRLALDFSTANQETMVNVFKVPKVNK